MSPAPLHRCARRLRGAGRRRARGVAMLVFMVVLALGSMAVLLAEVNNRSVGASEADGLARTRLALREAREALLGAAVGDVGGTERPGQLPWPDRAEVSDPDYDGRSDCVTGTHAAHHLMGRFPHLGEADIRAPDGTLLWAGCVGLSTSLSTGTRFADGSGEPLWYAVSANLLHTDVDPATTGTQLAPINWDILDNWPPGSGTPPFGAGSWMRVCDSRGRLVADRVAAVLIAPGAALAGQDRSGVTPGAAEFMESLTVVDGAGNSAVLDNRDFDGLADSGSGLTGPGECREFTTLGEEFVIPAGMDRDERAGFNDQLVYITAEELLEAVQRRAMNTVVQTLTAYRQAHSGRLPFLSPFASAENGLLDADPDSPLLEGTVASADLLGTYVLRIPDLPLDDSVVGAPIRNRSDGGTGVVLARHATFADGILVSVPDGGRNHDGASFGYAVGDVVQISTFRGHARGGGVLEGQLPFIDPLFPEDTLSDFSVEWNLFDSDVPAVFDIPMPASMPASYHAALSRMARSSALSGPVRVGNLPGLFDRPGVCRFVRADEVHCQGSHWREPILRATANIDSETVFELRAVLDVPDTAEAPFDFDDWGIVPGDLVRNLGDIGSRGVIVAVDADGERTVRVAGLQGGADNDFSVDDVVEFLSAAAVYGPFTVPVGSASDDQLSEPALAGLAGLRVGDVVWNETDDSYGLINSVSGATVTVNGLLGGTANRFEEGDQYFVRSHFIRRRQVSFDLRYRGAVSAMASTRNLVRIDNLAVRPVGAAPEGSIVAPAGPTDPVLDENGNYVLDVDGNPIFNPNGNWTGGGVGGENFIRIVDRDGGLAVRAQARVLVSPGTTEGYLSTQGIVRDFLVGTDIPEWFIDNGWHQFLYIAIGDAMGPDDTGTCSLTEPCIRLLHRRQATPPSAADLAAADVDLPAVVVGSGAALPAAPTVPQTRPSAQREDYFEMENIRVDAFPEPNTFETTPANQPVPPTFNDRITLVPDGP